MFESRVSSSSEVGMVASTLLVGVASRSHSNVPLSEGQCWPWLTTDICRPFVSMALAVWVAGGLYIARHDRYVNLLELDRDNKC